MFQSEHAKDIITEIKGMSQAEYTKAILNISTAPYIHSTSTKESYSHFERFVKQELGKSKKDNSFESLEELETFTQSEDTLQALYYVGGYMLRKLKLKNWSCIVIADIINKVD